MLRNQVAGTMQGQVCINNVLSRIFFFSFFKEELLFFFYISKKKNNLFLFSNEEELFIYFYLLFIYSIICLYNLPPFLNNEKFEIT